MYIYIYMCYKEAESMSFPTSVRMRMPNHILPIIHLDVPVALRLDDLVPKQILQAHESSRDLSLITLDP